MALHRITPAPQRLAALPEAGCGSLKSAAVSRFANVAASLRLLMPDNSSLTPCVSIRSLYTRPRMRSPRRVPVARVLVRLVALFPGQFGPGCQRLLRSCARHPPSIVLSFCGTIQAMENPPTRVALYVRGMNKDKRRGTDAQLAQLRQFCETQRWTIAAEHLDRATDEYSGDEHEASESWS